MLDPADPPGRPCIIRWQSRDEALILTADGDPLARLTIVPGGEPEVALLVEPATFEERALLCGALAWAVIEHVRGVQVP